MNRGKRFAVIIALALSVFIATYGCGKKGKDPASLIPDDAQLAIVIPQLGTTAANIGQFFDWVAKQRPELASYKQMAVAQTGVDFTKPEGLVQAGINPKGGLAIAVMDTKSDNGVIIISISSEKDFIAFLQKTAAGGQELKKEGDAYNMPNGGVVVIKKNLALMGPSKQTIDNILAAKKSIVDNPEYKTVMKNLGEGGDIVMFGSGKLLASAPMPGPEAEKFAELAKSLKAIGAKLNLNDQKVSLKIFSSTTQGDVFAKIVKSENGESLLEFLPGPASVLSKSKLNFQELYTYIKKTFVESDPQSKQQFDAGVAQIKAMMQMDVETDIVANINGNPLIAFYGMDAKGKTPRVALSIELKDESKIKELIGKISAMMGGGKKKKGELDAMGVTEMKMSGSDTVYIAVTKKNLLVTLDSATMKLIMSNVANNSTSNNAVSAIKQEDVKKLFGDKEKSVTYLSVSDLLDSFKSGQAAGIAMMISQSPGVATSYIVISYNVVPEGSNTDITITLGQ